jgi:hypothetical protein
LSPAAQRLADDAIAALGERSFLVSHPALGRLTSCLEYDECLVEAMTSEDCWQHVVTLRELIYGAIGVYEGPDEHLQILAYLRDKLTAALDGDEIFWGDEYPVHVAAQLRGTSGDIRTLGFVFSRFDEPVEWDGLYRDLEAYRVWLGSSGYLTSREQFENISVDIILGTWAKLAR